MLGSVILVILLQLLLVETADSSVLTQNVIKNPDKEFTHDIQMPSRESLSQII